MRIVISTIGSRGDVHPALALGVELRGRGHDVTVCAPPDFAADAAAASVPFRALGMPMAAQIDSAVGVLGRGRGLVGFRRAWEAQIPGLLAVLDEVAEGADLYLETSLVSCGITVAETWGVPYRYIALVPTVFPSRQHAPGFLPFESLPFGLNMAAARLSSAAISVLLGSTLAAVRRHRGLPVPSALDAWQAAFRLGTPILAADPTLAALPADLVGRVVQTGGMRLRSADPLSPELERFLSGGEPPVFIGFGSMPLAERADVASAVRSAMRAIGQRAVIQGLAPATLPDDRVLSVGREPFEKLFPRCAAVVHHGGAGTTLAAAAAGTPQVVVPVMADQHYWARRVHALGLGPGPVAWRPLARDLPRAASFASSPQCVEAARSLAAHIVADGAAATARVVCSAARGRDGGTARASHLNSDSGVLH